MGPRRGWAPVGQALFGAEQVYARGQHISKIGAMSLDGMMATMTTRGGVGSKEFRTFIEQRLAPHLRPGHIVCLAQSQCAQKCAGATTHPAVRGALAFSSTLQPDFNPIEAAWSKIKALIRKAHASCLSSLRAAMYRAF